MVKKIQRASFASNYLRSLGPFAATSLCSNIPQNALCRCRLRSGAVLGLFDVIISEIKCGQLIAFVTESSRKIKHM